MYSAKGISSIVQGWHGDVKSRYAFDDILAVYLAISKALVKIRSCCTVAETMILLQIVFLTICGELRMNTSSNSILEPTRMLKEVI